MIALSAYSPASSPDFMSVTPGPFAMPSAMRNGRSAAVPGSKTVSMWPISRTRGPPGRPSNVVTTVSPSRPAGIRPGLDAAAEPSRKAAVQPPTSLTPSGV